MSTNATNQAVAHLELFLNAHEAYQALSDGDIEEVELEEGYPLTDPDEVTEYICQQAYDLTVSGSANPGEVIPSEKYDILLAPGGPALRIVGDLGGGEPTSATLEWQDWGTPWTEYYVGHTTPEREALDWFVSLFYFGE